MNSRILVAALATSFVVANGFGQMNQGYGPPQSQPPSYGGRTEPSSDTKKKTTTKTTYPKGVKEYLDQQMAGSGDKKFHVALNGKDLPLTPTQFHQETKLGGAKSAMAVDMKGNDGKVYEIDFVMTNGQVTGAKVSKVNGKAP